MVKTVLQMERDGCGVACVATILGVPYYTARKLWGKRVFAAAGLGMNSLDRRLARAGLSVQRLYEKKGLPWPPEPWAPFHICLVDPDRKRKASSGKHHWVVMLKDGRVLDPARDGDLSAHHRTLGDYAHVWHVAGVFSTTTSREAAEAGLATLFPETQIQEINHRLWEHEHEPARRR